METVLTGHAVLLGDNIDTDQIYPGRFLDRVDPAEIGSHCLSGVREDFAQTFTKGDILVAGSNFGCGSSREHAPIALLNMGAAAVVAGSFARIFYRNAINLGLPLVVCKELEHVKEGEKIILDLLGGTLKLPGGRTLACEAIGEHAVGILAAGGIKPLLRRRLAQEK